MLIRSMPRGKLSILMAHRVVGGSVHRDSESALSHMGIDFLSLSNIGLFAAVVQLVLHADGSITVGF